MSTQRELDFSYSLIDRVFRLSLGETADYSNAKYDGDFSLTLEQAQRRKHEYVAREIRVRPGARVLDLTCGWGPMLRYLKELGAEGIGVNLSSAQAAACRRNGLTARVLDARTITPDTFGRFDGVVSVGGFEHFCSPEAFRAGRQEDIYRDVFRRVADLLPPGGRFYLQTMVFGRNMIPADQVDLRAPRDSDAYYLGLMLKQFPGSWLPAGRHQLERTAAPFLRLVSSHSGRLDYIETIRQWRRRFAAPTFRKTLLKLTLLPRYLLSADFRLAFASGVSANTVCFERELLDHYRMVFEKA
jgi:cyclopropane-fatty-acyl-phospholipid synthase